MSVMRKLLFLILSTLALALLPVMAIRGDLWLSSDFLHQEVSFILETKRMLATGAPWWSWNTYLGSDFIGSYSFYTLTSPFVWINCLFPESLLEVSLAITFVLKFLCLGALSWRYLRKMGVSRQNSAFGAYLFTFSSFSIASLYYYHFYEPIMVFVLLLLALERLLRRERWAMTGVALAAFAVTFVNFYFAVGSFFAALIYVIFRAFSGEVEFNGRVALKGVGAVLVGIVMCSFLLVPVYYQMLITTRADAQSAFDTTAMLNLLERLRTVLMPKIVEGTTVFVPGGSASYSNEACIALLGLSLSLIYAWRHRDWLSVLFMALLVLYLTPLNGIFTLFTNPLYTRWAYFLTLVIVLCSVRVLDEQRDVSRGVMGYVVLASVVVLAFVVKVLINNGMHLPGVRFVALVALFYAGMAALMLWARGKMSLRWIKVAAVVCTVAQMWLFLMNLGTDSLWYKSLQTNVEKGDGVVTCRSDFRGGNSFLTYNAGLLRNHASVEGYQSVITTGVDSLYKTATRDFWAKNKLRANVHQDEFDALLSVKTIYDIDSLGNVAKRDAEHFIPMGFAYDSYLSRSEFNKLMGDTAVNLPLAMLASVVIEDAQVETLRGLLKHGEAQASSGMDSVVAQRQQFVATHFKGTSRGFEAQVSLPAEKVMFFSVPYSDGFTATIDGKETPIYKANLCMMALRVPRGEHAIVLDYFPVGLKAGLWLSLLGVVLLLVLMWRDKKASEPRRFRNRS